jgi:hypothetical protein
LFTITVIVVKDMATVEEIQKEAAELNEKFQKSQEGREKVFV